MEQKFGKVVERVVSQAQLPSSELSQTNSNPEDYLRSAKLLLGCYRTGEANDPEVYVAAVVWLLSKYPLDVVQRVVDPVDGLPGRLKFLPTIPELRAALEEIEGPRRRMREWDLATQQQLAARVPEYKRPRRGLDATEFVARYGEIKARVDVPEAKEK